MKTHIPGSMRAFGHQLVRVQSGNQDASKPSNVFAFDSRKGDLTIIAQNAINPYYLDDGLLLYQIGDDSGSLVVRKLGDDNASFSSPPLEIMGDGQAYWGDYAATPQGDLVYVSNNTIKSNVNALWVADLESKSVRSVREGLQTNGFPAKPSLSPNGQYLAYTYREGSGNWNIHLFDLNKNIGRQITFQDNNVGPVFSSDGLWVYWMRESTGDYSIYRQPLNQSSPAEVFIEGAGGITFSPDGRFLTYTKGQRGKGRLFIRNMATDSDLVVDSISAFPYAYSFSPDGRYLAYSSDVSSTSQLINVKSTDGKETYTVPGIRGYSAHFSSDGDGLFIEAPRSIYYLPIRISPSFGTLGAAELILNVPYSEGFTLSPDGKLYVSATSAQFSNGEESVTNLVWLQNWSNHLQKELGK